MVDNDKGTDLMLDFNPCVVRALLDHRLSVSGSSEGVRDGAV